MVAATILDFMISPLARSIYARGARAVNCGFRVQQYATVDIDKLSLLKK